MVWVHLNRACGNHYKMYTILIPNYIAAAKSNIANEI